MMRRYFAVILFIYAAFTSTTWAGDIAVATLCGVRDAGHDFGGSWPKVEQYEVLLDLLVTEYEGTEAQLADVAFLAREMLLEKGVDASVFEILSDLSLVFRMDRKLDVRIYAASYVTLRGTGLSRSQVVFGLKAAAERNADLD